MTLDQTKAALVGQWVSIAPELRPSGTKNADGTPRPFYLHRTFGYRAGDHFTLDVVNSSDPYGQAPFVRIALAGQMTWRGDHPIAPGAQKVDFVADAAYGVTPLTPVFTEVLNRVAHEGYATWEVNVGQSVLGKAFPPFGLVAGQVFKEFDLVYLRDDLQFWGARHVDGRGFDTEENRPTNLQIPLVRR